MIVGFLAARGDPLSASGEWAFVPALLMWMPWPERPSSSAWASCRLGWPTCCGRVPIGWATAWSSKPPPSAGAPCSSRNKQAAGDNDSSSKGEVQDLMEELAEKKSGMGEVAIKTECFRFVVRGGQWTAAGHGGRVRLVPGRSGRRTPQPLLLHMLVA